MISLPYSHFAHNEKIIAFSWNWTVATATQKNTARVYMNFLRSIQKPWISVIKFVFYDGNDVSFEIRVSILPIIIIHQQRSLT